MGEEVPTILPRQVLHIGRTRRSGQLSTFREYPAYLTEFIIGRVNAPKSNLTGEQAFFHNSSLESSPVPIGITVDRTKLQCLFEQRSEFLWIVPDEGRLMCDSGQLTKLLNTSGV